MKKILYYIVAVLIIPVLGFGTLGGKDIGSLIPAQVVLVQSAGENVRLITDTGDEGTGKTVGQAIASMQEAASGEIYLDTAEHLLLEEGMDLWLEQLAKYLRPSCTLCRISGDTKLSELTEYLQVHPPELTMAEYEAGKRVLPRLICKKGRTKLV